MTDPTDPGHVCPKCHAPFEAHRHLDGTLCPGCFDQAFGVTAELPADPWRTTFLGGIICLAGAFLISLLVVASR